MIFAILAKIPFMFKGVFLFAQAFGTNCNPTKGGSFLGLPHWYEYIPTGKIDALGKCTPDVQIPEGIWPIFLALIDVLIRVAGFLAVIYIIIAGFQYITSQGNADKATSARSHIINALAGLAIAIVAAAVVRYIGNQFK